MTADHDQIAEMFDDLVASFRCGDREDAAAAFTRFERRLESHLAFEDDVLLPSLRRAHPAEAAELSAEHHLIRARLLELGVGVDLHLTRATWVAEFIELLRNHAHHEDELLYRWAHEPMPVDVPAALHQLPAL